MDNSIRDNSSIGIDLGGDGPTANDFGDNDTGANNLQNSPVITQAWLSGNQLTITYRVDSTAQASAYPMTIEFFVEDGNGQGETIVGINNYLTAERRTHKTITLTVGGVNIGEQLVATATDSNGNTSEFSAPVIVGANIFALTQQSSTDVNGDSKTTVLDALFVINLLDNDDAPATAVGESVSNNRSLSPDGSSVTVSCNKRSTSVRSSHVVVVPLLSSSLS